MASDPGDKIFSGPRTRADRLKVSTLNPQNGKTDSHRMTSAWSERVNFYSRHGMILSRETKMCDT